MYKQLMATAQTLNVSEPSDFSLIKQFNQEMTQQDAFKLALSFVDMQNEDAKYELIKIKDSMEEQIDNFNQIKRQSFQAHSVEKQMQICAEQFNSIEEKVNAQSKTSFNFHEAYISGLSLAVSTCLNKINLWRNQKKKILQKQTKSNKINRLLLKKYNSQNYLEQIILIKNITEKVKYKLNQNVPDFKFVEDMANRSLAPYSFYHTYSLNNCCKVIVKRIENKSLIILRQSENTIELLKHMQGYFFFKNNLYANCQQLITMINYLRVTNEFNITIQNGFVYLFKSYFINLLCEVNQIDCTDFLKARSIMQSSQETIDIWRDFQQIKIQSYCLWYYEQLQWLKNGQLIHVDRIRQLLNTFKLRYQWIKVIGIKCNHFQQNHDFNNDFIKLAIMKIITPVLSRLYYNSIPEDKIKSIQKYKKQFDEYWTYSMFFKYKNLYRFIMQGIKDLLHTFNNKTCRSEDNRQLNPQQFYLYYKQIPEIIQFTLNSKDMASQFNDFWCEISAHDYIFSGFNPKDQKNNNIDELRKNIQSFKNIECEQSKLFDLLKQKKLSKNEQMIQDVYGLLMNLNFISQKFFLIKKAAKLLGKKVQKQISSIRQVAYQLFLG